MTGETWSLKQVYIGEPIPLTEDWLLKFGFEKSAWTYQIDILPFPKEYKKLVVDLNQGILIRIGNLKNNRVNDELITNT